MNKSGNNILESYGLVVGEHVIDHLRQLTVPLEGVKVVHVNSTKEGGGVAEILHKLIPLKRALGIDASWEVIDGNPDFFLCTKSFHNGLQGQPVGISEKHLENYEKTNRDNADKLRNKLKDADIVIIHDPQPATLLKMIPERKGKWIWRCHIDVSRPQRKIWKYLKDWVSPYEASVFSLPEFAQTLPHTQYIITPSIDPLSDKNRELPQKDVDAIFKKFNLKKDVPILTQVSRFDSFKDPLGVIEAYKIAKKMTPLQLVLAGGSASDDPEGATVLENVRRAAEGDEDIHVLELPPDAHPTINALQRASTIITQKSTREGFGLTVTEGMWKYKPVIGGDTGGIRLQVVDHFTGFLVRTPEGAALRLRYLLHHRDRLEEMGQRAHRLVLENFLLTRHLREYLTLMLSLIVGETDRLEVWMWSKK